MRIIYHPKVLSEDIPRLNKNIALRIRKAIEERLMIAADKYGVRLRKGLGGYWKMRVGDYRIIYSILVSEVRIIIIGHRKDVYSQVGQRISHN